TYVIREYEDDNVIVSLKKGIELWHVPDLDYWKVFDLDVLYWGELPGELYIDDSSAPQGYTFDRAEFGRFVDSPTVILEGRFEGFRSENSKKLITLHNFDSSYWEVSVDPELEDVAQ